MDITNGIHENDENAILLTYYTSTIRQQELNFLQNGQNLNDQIMNFYFEYLYRNLLDNN